MLVATDIAARGVHVDEVELVVHVDPPAEHKAYLHRSGRTARAGSAGDVVTVVLPEQRKDLSALMRKAGINVRPQQVTAHCEPVTKLVGEVAPYRAPAPKAALPARAAPPGPVGVDPHPEPTGAGSPSLGSRPDPTGSDRFSRVSTRPRGQSALRRRSPVMLSASR